MRLRANTDSLGRTSNTWQRKSHQWIKLLCLLIQTRLWALFGVVYIAGCTDVHVLYQAPIPWDSNFPAFKWEMKHNGFATSLDVAVVVLCTLSVSWWAQLRGITIWIILLIHGFWWALAMTVLLTVIFLLAHVLLRGTCKAQDKADWACGLLRNGFLLSNFFFQRKQSLCLDKQTIESSYKDVFLARKRK